MFLSLVNCKLAEITIFVKNNLTLANYLILLPNKQFFNWNLFKTK